MCHVKTDKRMFEVEICMQISTRDKVSRLHACVIEIESR